MTEPRHAIPGRPKRRLLDFAITTTVALLVFGGIGYTLGQQQRPAQVVRPAAVETARTLTDGQPVIAGDGRLYYYRGWHLEAQFGHAHPLVSDTRNGPAKIAPGLKVTALP